MQQVQKMQQLTYEKSSLQDTPICEACGTRTEPVWCPDASKLRAWLCPNCLRFDRPTGREWGFRNDLPKVSE